MLEIFYKNKNINEYCNNLRLVQKDYGFELAKKLSQRESELVSFNNVNELLNSGIDNPHMLTGNLDGCIAWDLTSQVRIIIRIEEKFNEFTKENLINIRKVTIEGVIDYHGGNSKWLIN